MQRVDPVSFNAEQTALLQGAAAYVEADRIMHFRLQAPVTTYRRSRISIMGHRTDIVLNTSRSQIGRGDAPILVRGAANLPLEIRYSTDPGYVGIRARGRNAVRNLHRLVFDRDRRILEMIRTPQFVFLTQSQHDSIIRHAFSAESQDRDEDFP